MSEDNKPDGEAVESAERPKELRHGDKHEGQITDSLINLGEEASGEEFLELITWDNYENVTGWEATAPNVRYHLPTRRRKPAASQHEDPQSAHRGNNHKKRCYELDFVDSPAWKICVEPTTYRYLPNNGRYRASKLAKKLEIQKSVRKTCNEKLTPEQRYLQREIHRELKREFEVYMQLEKQRQAEANIEKRSKDNKSRQTEDTIEERDEQSVTGDYETSVESVCSSQSTGTVEEQSSTPPKPEKNVVQKHSESPCGLPPIHVPLTKTRPDFHTKKHLTGATVGSNGPISASVKVFKNAKFCVEGQHVESENDVNVVPKNNKRAMSEPPPLNSHKHRGSPHSDAGPVPCQSEPQTYRQGFDSRDSLGKIGYTQSMCDIRQPTHSIPSKTGTVVKDMIQVKPITTGQVNRGRYDPAEMNNWNIEQSNGQHSTEPGFSIGQQYHNGAAAAAHSNVNSAPAFQSRTKPGQDMTRKDPLEIALSTSKFSSAQSLAAAKSKTPYRASLTAAKKSGKLHPKPSFQQKGIQGDQADLSDDGPLVGQAFHSVPINKIGPRSKKQQPAASPPGLLPEISGHKIPVSLTTQKFL